MRFKPKKSTNGKQNENSCVKTKIQLGKPEDLIGFIERFINPAASSHLASRRELRRAGYNGRLFFFFNIYIYNKSEGRARLAKRKARLFSGKFTFP